MNVSGQVTALSGALAAERTDREGVSAELDQLKSASREKESIIKQQQVRGRSEFCRYVHICPNL